MADHQESEALRDLKRVATSDLVYPVLLLSRDAFVISPDSKHIPSGPYLRPKPSLLIDGQGMSYRVVEIHDHFFPGGQPLPRAERRRLREQGAPPPEIFYNGEPVLLSVSEVREKIIWLVSAQGHFEIPQGLPDSMTVAESVQELLGDLLTRGWRDSLGPPTKPWWPL